MFQIVICISPSPVSCLHIIHSSIHASPRLRSPVSISHTLSFTLSPSLLSSVSSLPFTPSPILSLFLSPFSRLRFPCPLLPAPCPIAPCSPLLPHKPCQCIHQRALPVDGDLVCGIIFLFVVPSCCRMSATYYITRPRIHFIVGT